MLNVDTWDGLRVLSEEDQYLFRRLRPRDNHELLVAKLDAVTNREPFEWEIEAQARIDKAALDHAVYTQSGDKLECWNCAFFVGDLQKDSSTNEYQRNPYGGYCYRELPREETRPGSFCSRHSALQGYLRSKAELYNIAPVE